MSIASGSSSPAAICEGAKHGTRARTASPSSQVRLPTSEAHSSAPCRSFRHCDSVAASRVPRGSSSGLAANPAGGSCRKGLLACDSARLTALP